MPALQPVPKVVRVDVHMTDSADANSQIRLFLQYSGTLSQSDALTWANTIASGFVSNILNLLSNTIILSSTVLTDLTSATAAQAVSTTTGTGSLSSASLAAGSAAVLRQKIARRYRGGHPRKYIPGVVAGNLGANQQTLATTFITNLATGWNNFITACQGPPAAVGSVTEVNVSYFQGFHNVQYPSGRMRPVATPRGTPVVDIVTGHSVNPRIGSQRRRNLQSA